MLGSDHEFQTRDEDGTLNFYESLEEAIKAYDNDKTIYKISYSTDNGKNYRWVIKEPNDMWEDEDKLNEISESYRNKKEDDIFWVNQVMPIGSEIPQDYYINYDHEKISQFMYRTAIRNVVSDKEFRDSVFMQQFM
jgi:hypothetical protein